MSIERFDEHLSLRLPDGFTFERGLDDSGREMMSFLPTEGTEDEARLILRSTGKEAELEEAKRNHNGRFHICVTAKLGEVPGLFGSARYFLTAVVFEYRRHVYVLSAHKGINDREDLTFFAERSAAFLNEVLSGITIDGESAGIDTITARQLLELAGVADPVDGNTPDEEEQRRAAEQFMREHPDGEGVSVRAVYRDPITGKMKRDLFWERAGAESGDPDAMGQMALAYMNGDGVEQSDEKALEYMRKAAELDSSTAQFNMGMFCAQGRGVKRDFAQARYWMEQARNNGDMDAAGALRTIADAEKLQAAADAGDPAAQEQFARILCSFRSEQNERDALAYAKKSAEAGCADGMDFVGQAYEHRIGVEQDYAEAFRWYKAAAEAGHAGSQSRLACLYKRGDGVEQNDELAMMWMRKAAAQGNEFAQQTLRYEEERSAQEAEFCQQQEKEARKRADAWLKQYGGCVEKNPEVVISGRSFVFTGIASIAAREEMSAALEKMAAMGGVERAAVSGKTDYLVVDPRDAGEGKVKKALEQKAKGKDVKIVLLEDFLKALGMEQDKAANSAAQAGAPARDTEAESRRLAEEAARRAEKEQQEQAARAAREAEERRKREAEEARKRQEAELREKERKEREAKAAREAEERRQEEEANRKRQELEDRMRSIRAELDRNEKAKEQETAALAERSKQNEAVLGDLIKRKKKAGLFSFGKRKELRAKIQILQEVKIALEKEKEKLEATHREAREALLAKLRALEEESKDQ